MGWWATGVFDGDTPLDFVCDVEDVLGVEDLYPLAAWTDDTRAAVAAAVADDAVIDRLVSRLTTSGYAWGDQVGAQVLAAMIMASGAPMPAAVAELARSAAAGDEWAGESPERRQSMDDFVALLDGYAPPTPSLVGQKGLFQAIAEGR